MGFQPATDDESRSRAFGIEVRAEVAAHFAQSQISSHANFEMVLKSLLLATAYFGSYTLLLLDFADWPLNVALCVMMGFGLAGMGFSVAHDALHGAYSANPAVNRVLGFVFETLGGNGYAWTLAHNGAHHSMPNVSGHDEDIEVTPLLRLSPHSPHLPIHRFQHLFAFALYALATLNWAFVRDFVYFTRPSEGPLANRPHEGSEWARLVVGKLLFYAAMSLPFFLLRAPAWHILIGLLTVHLTAGLTLGIVFQLAHSFEGAGYVPASEASDVNQAWAAHQLRTTTNFAANNHVLSWYIGGLNYQVEHHLFPRICHVHYPRISRIVQRVARRHGFAYNSLPTFRDALGAHYRMLRQLGAAA